MQRGPIDGDALRATLGTRVRVVETAESTNVDLLADRSAPSGSVLLAEHQIAGRGRLDRSWVSPARAGLTFSVLLRPEPSVSTWGWLPLLVGVALRDAVVGTSGLDVVLKWPNDLLCGAAEAKLAGILAQTSERAVVVGIGLNVSTTREELPVASATSLELCGAEDVDRTELLIAVLKRLDELVTRWSDAGGDAERSGLAAAYRAACSTLGREVAVTTTAGGRVVGRAQGIDADGRLEVLVGGRTECVVAGDVEHLRATDRAGGPIPGSTLPPAGR